MYRSSPPNARQIIDKELKLDAPLESIEFKLNRSEHLPNTVLGDLSPSADLNVLKGALIAADSGNFAGAASELKVLFKRLDRKYGDIQINGKTISTE